MITLYLVRHGETVWNKAGKYQGTADISLSELGEKQSEKTIQWFQDKKIDKVFSSPLKRAKVTAEGIAFATKASLEIKNDLRELCFGAWEGKTFLEIEEQWPGMIEDMYHNPEDLQIPDGETFRECQIRCMKAINEIISREDNKTYVIVCHGAALRTIICDMIDISLKKSWNMSLSNASISCIQVYPNDMNVLHYLNSTFHLS